MQNTKQVLDGDNKDIFKRKREFYLDEDLVDKIDSIEYGAQVNKIEEIEVNGVPVEPDGSKTVHLNIPRVIDAITSDSSTDALSAKMGQYLYSLIQGGGGGGGGGGEYIAGQGIRIIGDIISNSLPGATVSATAPSSPTEGQLWYDTTNDVLKSYDGSQRNEIVSSGSASDLNTKTFFLTGTTGQDNLDEASALIDWLYEKTGYDIGSPVARNAIIVYNDGSSEHDKAFHLLSIYNNSGYLQLIFSREQISLDPIYGTPRIYRETIDIHQFPSLGISFNSEYVNFLSTNNTVQYTPTGNYNPATKKYVDDAVGGVVSLGSTAPSNPTEGQLWYDTTNDVLKTYNGSSWDEAGGGIKNDTTGTTSTIEAEWVGTQAEFNALSSYGNKIYNIIE